MSGAGPAELFCRAATKLATNASRVQYSYGDRLRSAAQGARAQAHQLVESDRAGQALRLATPAPDNRVWIPGRLWRPSDADETPTASAQRLPRVWFRSDSVDYDILQDAQGRPSGLSFTSQEPDLARRAHWARATDRRGDREYEIAAADAVRGRPGYQWVDRSDTRVVPAPWHHPDTDAQMFTVSPHGTTRYHLLNVRAGNTESGEPNHVTVAADGWGFGTYLSTNPDFWRIAEHRGGDMVITGCDIGGTPATLAARAVHAQGFDHPVHGATGGVWMQAHHPDGTLQAQEIPGKFDPEWDPNPTRSSLVVIDGEFITLHPRQNPGAGE